MNEHPLMSEQGGPTVGMPTTARAVLETRALSVFAGSKPLLRNVTLAIPRGEIFGIIGPSGVGKSTLLRCLNRLVDLTTGLRVEGDILYQGRSIRAPGADPDQLRTRIGMLFQQPVVFPRSIEKNVLFGVRHLGQAQRKDWPEIVERALHEAALWPEVKDRLRESAFRLSIGQQQRLCLARALAVNPDVILMDEPTSALDPKSTEAVEELMLRLKPRRTIVLVTHNLDQARRVTDWVACLCLRDGVGEAVETACCDALFTHPQCRDVADYLGSRFLGF